MQIRASGSAAMLMLCSRTTPVGLTVILQRSIHSSSRSSRKPQRESPRQWHHRDRKGHAVQLSVHQRSAPSPAAGADTWAARLHCRLHNEKWLPILACLRWSMQSKWQG
jgi:hypothetical protein